MDDSDPPKPRHRAIPSSRAARLGTFGRLAGGVAGGMLGEGARRLDRPAACPLPRTHFQQVEATILIINICITINISPSSHEN